MTSVLLNKRKFNFSYLTKDGEVYLERVQMILDGLGKAEDEIFRSRQV